jgi:hypothetical protein
MAEPVPHKPKRFRLSFVGATEDQPRLFRAYGKACGGEFALVMRPSEGKGLMVFLTREGAWSWRAGEPLALPEGAIRTHAEVVQLTNAVRLRVLVGPHKGSAFTPHGKLPSGVTAGDRVEISFHPDDQYAHILWPSDGASDAPRRPDSATTAKEAIAAIKAEQKGLPEPGPTTLRGQWVGVLHCTEAGQPQVELWRKLAAYGTLRVFSDPGGSWSWRFERGEKWFSGEAEVAGEGLLTLSSAIEAGVLGAMRLVREACSFRDTRRRAAHDAAYAEKHPLPAPKVGKDPTERLKEPPPPKAKKPRASRAKMPPATEGGQAQGRAAAPPRPIEDRPLPVVPEDPKALTRLAQATQKQASVLAEVAGITRAWEELTPATELLAWYEDHDHEELAERLRDYLARPERTLDSLIAELRDVLDGSELADEERLEAALRLDLLEASLRSAPVLMERARKLIRYAVTMTRSPLCQGKEQREAAEAAKRAVDSYDKARSAILEGRSWDALRTLRRMGERVALSAAKVARSCALGQQSLTAAVAEVPAPKGKAPPRARKPRAAKPKPAVVASLPADSAEVDPAKDKALLDAFSAAIAAAMQGAA